MLEPAVILFTLPMKSGDPTQITYSWGKNDAYLAKSLGYKVIIIEKDNTTYDNVSMALEKYSPNNTGTPLIYRHLGHGCAGSLIGNNECMINRQFSFDELYQMNRTDPEKFRKLVYPLKGLSCFNSGTDDANTCRMDSDPCSPMCTHPTNVHLLKDVIVCTTACWSGASLGMCALKGGARNYIGYSEIYMFVYDSKGSHKIFEHIESEFNKNLLMGKSIGEAEQNMIELEDDYIRKYKKIKFIALPLLWNKKYRKIFGNKNNTIY